MLKILRIQRKPFILLFLMLFLAFSFLFTHHKNQSQLNEAQNKLIHIELAAPINTADNETVKATTATSSAEKFISPIKMSQWKTVTVKNGDTLLKILKTEVVAAEDLRFFSQATLPYLTLLRANNKIHLLLDEKQHLVSLKYDLSLVTSLLITKKNQQFVSKIIHHPETKTLSFKSIAIHGALQPSLLSAGLSNQMFQEIQQMFQGRINFNRDIRAGDSLAVLYEEYYSKGKFYRTGHIVAAEFTNKNKKYQSVRYTDPKKQASYYTPDGKGVTPLFLQKPVNYIRISSYFSAHRYDPVIHRIHSHFGIDYAAETGTPIHSIGNGKVIFVGREGGYGNAVKIQYGRSYQALYGHMQRFAKNLKAHQAVAKGQVIGYVGSTGWATGHHLHFSFFIKEKPVNWLRFSQPHTNPIPPAYFKNFLNHSQQLLATLNLYQQTHLAANDQKANPSAS